MTIPEIPLPDIDFSGILSEKKDSLFGLPAGLRSLLCTGERSIPPKMFYFDVETTGLQAGFNEICQIGIILDIEGETVWEYESIVRPCFPCRIHPGAVETHGITLNRMRYEGIGQRDLHFTICNNLNRYIDKYDTEDKAFPSAFNGLFDYQFISALWHSCNDSYLGSYLNHRIFDPLAYFRILACKYGWNLPNMKLSTIAEHLGIPILAHDALSDTRALRKLVYMIFSEL